MCIEEEEDEDSVEENQIEEKHIVKKHQTEFKKKSPDEKTHTNDELSESSPEEDVPCKDDESFRVNKKQRRESPAPTQTKVKTS